MLIPSKFNTAQKGLMPVIVLLMVAAAIIFYIIFSNTASFKDSLFSNLFPKPPSHASEKAESVPDEILLKFKAGVSEKVKENIKNQHALEVLETIPQIDVLRVKVTAQSKDAVIEALSHNPNVEYVEPNYINQAVYTPNDTYFPNQWNLSSSKLNMSSAWDISRGNSSVVIAIIDTGVDLNHEDLAGKATGDLDDNGHGTQVAGIAGSATNNALGIAGVCPLCQMRSIKVLGSSGDGSDSGVAAGIIKATDTGAKIINLSLGSYSLSSTMASAVNYSWNKGVVITAGAGNDGTTVKFYPAAYPNVLAAGATASDDSKASISNYGDWVDVFAPGQGVVALKMSGGYTLASGTSMASPHVAGLAGLILSAKPGLTNQVVSDIIISTSDTLSFGKRINAYKALQKATGITVTPDTQAPSVSISSPTANSTVSGLTDITVNATDNVGVTKVEFYIDGVLLGSDVSSPYIASWDTTSLTNGSIHTLSAKAFDNAGNVATSSSVSVNVGNIVSTPAPSDSIPPAVSITSPVNGATIKTSSKLTITANATDDTGISKVEFYINNSLRCTSTPTSSNLYTCTYPVPGKKNSSYTITATAYDLSNNTDSNTITVRAQ